MPVQSETLCLSGELRVFHHFPKPYYGCLVVLLLKPF